MTSPVNTFERGETYTKGTVKLKDWTDNAMAKTEEEKTDKTHHRIGKT